MEANHIPPLDDFLAQLDSAFKKNISTSTADLNEQIQQSELESKRLKNKDKKTDIDLKKIYGESILGILIAWLFFVGIILIGQFGFGAYKFSDTVIITLITTTTANVIALPTIVLNYLFPNPKK